MSAIVSGAMSGRWKSRFYEVGEVGPHLAAHLILRGSPLLSDELFYKGDVPRQCGRLIHKNVRTVRLGEQPVSRNSTDDCASAIGGHHGRIHRQKMPRLQDLVECPQ